MPANRRNSIHLGFYDTIITLIIRYSPNDRNYFLLLILFNYCAERSELDCNNGNALMVEADRIGQRFKLGFDWTESHSNREIVRPINAVLLDIIAGKRCKRAKTSNNRTNNDCRAKRRAEVNGHAEQKVQHRKIWRGIIASSLTSIQCYDQCYHKIGKA